MVVKRSESLLVAGGDTNHEAFGSLLDSFQGTSLARLAAPEEIRDHHPCI